MIKKIAALSLALTLSVPMSAFAGASGGTQQTSTTTNTTSTSTSSSTSSSTSKSSTSQTLGDRHMRTYDLGYYVQGYAYETGHGSASVGWITYSQNNYRSGLELLTQGPAYSASGDANAWHPHVYLPDRCYSLKRNVQSNVSYGTVAAVNNWATQSYDTTYQTSYQTSYDTTQQVTTENIYAGDVLLAINTNTNTNVNTNTNTNVNTNVHTTTNNFSQRLTANTTYTTYTVVEEQYVSPIVLDLSGTGKLDASEGNWLPHAGLKGKRLAMFDIRGNGFEMAVEWLGPKQGLLFEPRADGTVDGSCLFGQASGYSDGYKKLSLRDKNSDNKLTGAELNGLYVWVDSNSNARIDKNEVSSVGDLKITEIGCTHRAFKSTFVMDGKRETMWDWFPTALDVQKRGIVTKR